MVCLSNDGMINVTVTDTMNLCYRKQCSVLLSPTKSVDNVFVEVSSNFHYESDSFELVLQSQNGDTVSNLFLDCIYSYILLLYLTHQTHAVPTSHLFKRPRLTLTCK